MVIFRQIEFIVLGNNIIPDYYVVVSANILTDRVVFILRMNKIILTQVFLIHFKSLSLEGTVLYKPSLLNHWTWGKMAIFWSNYIKLLFVKIFEVSGIFDRFFVDIYWTFNGILFMHNARWYSNIVRSM